MFRKVKWPASKVYVVLHSDVSIAAVLAWVVAIVVRSTVRLTERLFAAPHEQLAPPGLCAMFGLLVVSQQPWGYCLIALLSVSSIVRILASSPLLPVLLIGGWSDQVSTSRLLIGPGALVLLLAFTLLTATASFR